MNLLMLCREPRLYSCQRLQETALARGHQMAIFDPNRFLLQLQPQAPSLALRYQAKDELEAKPLAVFDAVLPRFGISSTHMGCAVLRQLQARGAKSLNSPLAIEQARDKWRSLQLLVAQGIAVPPSALAGVEMSAAAALADFPAPLVFKTLQGMQGLGVMLAEGAASARSLWEFLQQSQHGFLQQQFIAEAQNADIRAFVVGDKVVAAMERQGKEGEFRANFHRGGKARAISLSQTEAALAVQTTQALGLDVAGVDLIASENGLLVLEVNASPGLELIEKVSGVDIAATMLAHLEGKTA